MSFRRYLQASTSIDCQVEENMGPTKCKVKLALQWTSIFNKSSFNEQKQVDISDVVVGKQIPNIGRNPTSSGYKVDLCSRGHEFKYQYLSDTRWRMFTFISCKICIVVSKEAPLSTFCKLLVMLKFSNLTFS